MSTTAAEPHRPSPFPEVNAWRIPIAAWVASLDELALDGELGREGIAFWLGRREAGVAVVSAVALLRGPLIRKLSNQIVIDAGLVNELTDAAIAAGSRVVGQVHSHGGWTTTDLSETDRELGLAVPYHLSVVVPDFGRRHVDPTDCGVHFFVPGEGFRRLSRAQVAVRLRLIDTGWVAVLKVGEL
jgi:proteasome lid subunit RPN8/RPN11